MSSRNVIDFLAHSAPSAIGYLQIPLTPSTAARLADFTARTGVDPQTFVLDLLEDAIFDIDGSVEFVGAASCVSDTRNCPQSTEESNASSCGVTQDFASRTSEGHGKASFQSSQPKNSPLSSDAVCEPPNTKSAASTTLPRSPSGHLSTSVCQLGNDRV